MSAAILLPLDLAPLAVRVAPPRSAYTLRLRPEGALLLAERSDPSALGRLMAASSASSASLDAQDGGAPSLVGRSRR